jgi:hypothetical protein
MASRLDDAKARLAQEKSKVTSSIKALAGSPALIAVFAVCVLAFGSHVAFFRDRLPAMGDFTVASFGLPPLDFGVLGDAVRDAIDAALRQGAAVEAQNFLAANGDHLIPILNGVGFGASLVLLIWALAIQSERRRKEAIQGILNRA